MTTRPRQAPPDFSYQNLKIDETQMPGYLTPMQGLSSDDIQPLPGAGSNFFPDLTNFQRYNMLAELPTPSAMNFGFYANECLSRAMSRWQNVGQGNVGSWDSVTNRPWFHYTFFPCRRRIASSARNVDVEDRGLFFVAFYSNFNPWVQGGAQEGRSIPFVEPNFKQVRVDQTGSNPSTLNIDVQFLDQYSGQDNFAAIIASLNNTRPGNNNYLCFFPLVTAQQFSREVEMHGHGNATNRIVEKNPRKTWALEGASLGIAVAAVIMGLPSIAYTGFLGTVEENTILVRPTPANNNNITAKIPAQMNFIESVEDIPLKAALAQTRGVPLIIPNRDVYNRPFNAARVSEVTASIIGWLPAVRTMADIVDGHTMLSDARNGKSDIGLCANLSDCMLLSAYMWSARMYAATNWAAEANSTKAADMLVRIRRYFDTKAAKVQAEATQREATRKAIRTSFGAARGPQQQQQVRDQFMADTLRKYNAMIAARDQKRQARLQQIQSNVAAQSARRQMIARMASLKKLLKYGRLSTAQRQGAESQLENLENQYQRAPKSIPIRYRWATQGPYSNAYWGDRQKAGKKAGKRNMYQADQAAAERLRGAIRRRHAEPFESWRQRRADAADARDALLNQAPSSPGVTFTLPPGASPPMSVQQNNNMNDDDDDEDYDDPTEINDDDVPDVSQIIQETVPNSVNNSPVLNASRPAITGTSPPRVPTRTNRRDEVYEGDDDNPQDITGSPPPQQPDGNITASGFFDTFKDYGRSMLPAGMQMAKKMLTKSSGRMKTKATGKKRTKAGGKMKTKTGGKAKTSAKGKAKTRSSGKAKGADTAKLGIVKKYFPSLS